MADERSSAGALSQRWIRSEIRDIAAYHVPDSAGFVKLDAMENPYTWPPELVEEWLALLRETPVNRYPDPEARMLTSRLRSALDLSDDVDLLLGNGSDEIIQMLALATVAGQGWVLAPEPAFAMYRMIATFVGARYVGVPLDEQFSLDVPAMLSAIETHHPALVFLAYPNNPTGNLFDGRAMEAVIEAAPGLVVVDEAYHAFAGRSFIDRLRRFPNLLVMRTLSKSGLAGLRLGFLAGAREWLAEIDKVRLPYNINVLTQVSAEFALRHGRVFEEQTGRLRQERQRLFEALDGFAGLTVYPSAANFILFRADQELAERVFDRLEEQRIRIKTFHRSEGPLQGCLRVTVGKPEENDALLAVLGTMLERK